MRLVTLHKRRVTFLQFASLAPDNRLKERKQLSRPVFDEFYNWTYGLATLKFETIVQNAVLNHL